MSEKLFYKQEYLLAVSTAKEYLKDVDKLILFLKKNKATNKHISGRIEFINDYDSVFITVSKDILNSLLCKQVIDKKMQLF